MVCAVSPRPCPYNFGRSREQSDMLRGFLIANVKAQILMPDNIDDPIPVAFRGSTVECASLDDAGAIQTADSVLKNTGPCDQSPRQLDQIAEVLSEYGRDDAARAVAHLAGKERATHS